jgi:uncharacterized membrane protein
MSIRNPVEWGVDQFRQTLIGVQSTSRDILQAEDEHLPLPTVRKISAADLKDVLIRGAADFGAHRTDVLFLCALYPVIGLVLIALVAEYKLLPLLFPLASGFALIGPFIGVGLNEMSRRRELGTSKGWTDAFGVLQSHSLGGIIVLGSLLVMTFFAWMVTAYLIYDLTLGPAAPVSINSFIHNVFTTGPGRTMIVVGVGAGFLFAAVVLVNSVVAFPLLLDRNVGIGVAVGTSVEAALTNPGPVALWGLIVVAGLVLGSIPALVGLIIVLPILGHSSWHLYRKMVVAR